MDLEEEGTPQGEGPLESQGPDIHVGPNDLTVAEARVEIRALWARVHELELEIQQLRQLLRSALFQIQVHG